MRDDQLSRLFGSLSDESEPDPSFADGLFDELRLEATGAARPARRGWFMLLAAALLVSALAAGAALGSGIVRLPWVVVEPISSASSLPTASPSLPVATDDVLPFGSVALVLTDLDLHALPSTSSPVLANIPAGQVIYVQGFGEFGPREADGGTWYPVAWALNFDGWPAGVDGGYAGWLPVTQNGSATVELVHPRCPASAAQPALLAEMTPWARLTCYGNDELTLEGTWVTGAGGIVPWEVEPAWLGLPAFDHAIADVTGGEAFYFVLSPDVEVPPILPASGGTVRISGHFDDPAAASCVIQAGEPMVEQPAETVQVYCRERFVATSVDLLNDPGSEQPAVNAIVALLVDGVRLRGEPGVDGEVLGTLGLGQWSYVVDGPRQADGYAWWLLAGLGIPANSGCLSPIQTDPFDCPIWYGWAAGASLDGDPWLAAVDPSCPPESGPLTQEFGQQPLVYLACFGDRTRTYVGWLPEIPDNGGPGGACPGVADELLWLACGLGSAELLVEPGGEFSGRGLGLAVDPRTGVDLDALRGLWVRVTGHFDDPAAAGCGSGPNPEYSVLECRARFVVESIEQSAVPS